MTLKRLLLALFGVGEAEKPSFRVLHVESLRGRAPGNRCGGQAFQPAKAYLLTTATLSAAQIGKLREAWAMKSRLVLLLCIFGMSVLAQTAVPQRGSEWYTPMAYVPNTATNIVTATTFLDFAFLANTSASSVTCTFVDKTTACGGTACQVWPAVTMAANATYLIQFDGLIVTSGVQWSCSSASAVVGQMRGAYTR
jgi:hypothetical protein